jgi:hypothetical protein
MKNYSVSIPFTGYITVKVKAKNQEEAKDKAWESNFDFKEAVEVDYHEHIVLGNCFCGILNEIEVEEI